MITLILLGIFALLLVLVVCFIGFGMSMYVFLKIVSLFGLIGLFLMLIKMVTSIFKDTKWLINHFKNK